MNRIYLPFLLQIMCIAANAQDLTQLNIEADFGSSTLVMPQDILTTQILFVGGVDEVQY